MLQETAVPYWSQSGNSFLWASVSPPVTEGMRGDPVSQRPSHACGTPGPFPTPVQQAGPTLEKARGPEAPTPPHLHPGVPLPIERKGRHVPPGLDQQAKSRREPPTSQATSPWADPELGMLVSSPKVSSHPSKVSLLRKRKVTFLGSTSRPVLPPGLQSHIFKALFAQPVSGPLPPTHSSFDFNLAPNRIKPEDVCQ